MYKLMLFLVLSMVLIVNAALVQAQGDGVIISLLDRNGAEVSGIMDGNNVQLRVKLPSAAQAAVDVAFILESHTEPVATCSLPVGSSSCTSSVFATTGWFWDAQGASHAQRVIHAIVGGKEAPSALNIDIHPRPVVMVHGFLSSWVTWKPYLGPDGYLASIGLQGFAVGDGQAPGVLNTGSPSNPAGRTNSIKENAEILGQYISAVQKQTGAEKVDLLVHSMGGMISRFYIDRVMQNDTVAQVIFLGSPMSGSACTYPLASLGFLLPASLEILPDYMIHIFNQQIIHRHGIPFYMVAGTLLIDPLTSPCASAPSDTVVAFGSATSIALDGIQELPMFHGDLTTNKQVFDNDVRHLLQSPPGSFAPRQDLVAPSENTLSEQFSRAYTGHLKPGETAQVTINIDPNVSLANFSLYDSSRSLEIEVRGASGNVIVLDTQKNGVLKIEDPATMLYLGYGFKQPKPGKWVVTLKTTGVTPPAGADYSIIARFTGGMAMTASSSVTIPSQGQVVVIQARLQSNGSSPKVESATAQVRKPDGTQESLNLTANGDGYTVDYKPDQTGLYSAEVMLAGQGTDGFGFDRAVFIAFEVQPNTAEVEPVRVTVMLALAGLCLVAIIILALMLIARRRKKQRAG